MGISEEQVETLSTKPKVSLESFKKVIATKRDEEEIGLTEVKESQDELALRQERSKLGLRGTQPRSTDKGQSR